MLVNNIHCFASECDFFFDSIMVLPDLLSRAIANTPLWL